MRFKRIYLLNDEGSSYSTPRFGCYDWSSPIGEDWSSPIGDYRYDWYVIRNGVRTDCTKVFTVYENDTTSIELFY